MVEWIIPKKKKKKIYQILEGLEGAIFQTNDILDSGTV